jgi:hypothetical protein
MPDLPYSYGNTVKMTFGYRPRFHSEQCNMLQRILFECQGF